MIQTLEWIWHEVDVVIHDTPHGGRLHLGHLHLQADTGSEAVFVLLGACIMSANRHDHYLNGL